MLAGLASSALGMLIVRNARQKLITGLARIAVFVVCLVGLFGLKPLRDSMADVDLSRPSPFRNRLPGPQQGDSVIVLPAYCFLDASFDPMEALSDDERDHLAHNGLQSNAAVQAILIMLIFIAVALSKYIFGLRARWDISESNKAGGRVCGGDGSLVGYIIIAFLKFIAWGIVIGLVAWNWASIFLLRDWAEKSGWLRLDDGWNEERDVQGLGQIAPLIALGAIGVVITDALSQFTAPKEDNNVVVTAQAPQSPVHANSFPLQNLTSQTRGRQGYSQIPHPV